MRLQWGSVFLEHSDPSIYSWSNNIWVRSWNCGCLVTWFCYQLIAKPGNKTAAVLWPNPYGHSFVVLLGHIIRSYLIDVIHIIVPGPMTQSWRISISTAFKPQQSTNYVHNSWDVLCLILITVLLWGESTAGFPSQRDSNVELWCFLWC